MNKIKILVVDDEPINLDIIAECLSDEGYELLMEANGTAAWEQLQRPDNAIDVVILDRMMPGLNGIEVLQKIKAESRYKHIPVIMQTALSAPAEVREGLEAGAYYYLTKPFDPGALISIVRAAVESVNSWKRQSARDEVLANALQIMGMAEYRFTTVQHVRVLSTLCSFLCPMPELAAIGLSELLMNAVEHGNLGISYAEKKALKLADDWDAEIARRLDLPEFRERQAVIRMERLPAALRFTVIDQGKGFDWQNYLTFDPERAFDPNGRGIAMARQLSFSRLEYRGCGNCVIAEVELPKTT